MTGSERRGSSFEHHGALYATLLCCFALFVPGAVRADVDGSIVFEAAASAVFSPLKEGDGYKQAGAGESLGSTVELKLVWGGRWFENLGFTIHSDTSLLPLEVDRESLFRNALYHYGIDAGSRRRGTFGIALEFQEFRGNAVVTDDGKLYRGAAPLVIGDRFRFVTNVDIATVRWYFAEDTGGESLFDQFEGYVGIGLARFSNIGIVGVNPLPEPDGAFEFGTVEQETSERGVLVEAGYDFVSDGLFLYKMDFEWLLGSEETSGQEYRKFGTALGLALRLNKRLVLKPHVGAYYWRIINRSPGMDSLLSTVGLTLGVAIELENAGTGHSAPPGRTY